MCPVPRLRDPHRRPGVVLLGAVLLAGLSLAWSALAQHATVTLPAYADRTMTAPQPATEMVSREPTLKH